MPLVFAAVVPFEDTFITVGGDTSSGDGTDKVWQLKSNMRFEELRHLRLLEPKSYATAMLASSTQLK